MVVMVVMMMMLKITMVMRLMPMLVVTVAVAPSPPPRALELSQTSQAERAIGTLGTAARCAVADQVSHRLGSTTSVAARPDSRTGSHWVNINEQFLDRIQSDIYNCNHQSRPHQAVCRHDTLNHPKQRPRL